jgi:hypothetical protein
MQADELAGAVLDFEARAIRRHTELAEVVELLDTLLPLIV